MAHLFKRARDLYESTADCLGIRFSDGDLIVDPVLPKHLDGLEFSFGIMEKPAVFVYHLNEEKTWKNLRQRKASGGEETGESLPGGRPPRAVCPAGTPFAGRGHHDRDMVC
ncbi:hypothetical protein [Caldibacillus debilis]|uniref:hypothetical protein n=1 Tax=Caldibacillus debilis TaxID=301148 RepID=UPI003C6CAD72